MAREKGEDYQTRTIDPDTGTVEIKEIKPADLSKNPEEWREQK